MLTHRPRSSNARPSQSLAGRPHRQTVNLLAKGDFPDASPDQHRGPTYADFELVTGLVSPLAISTSSEKCRANDIPNSVCGNINIRLLVPSSRGIIVPRDRNIIFQLANRKYVIGIISIARFSHCKWRMHNPGKPDSDCGGEGESFPIQTLDLQDWLSVSSHPEAATLVGSHLRKAKNSKCRTTLGICMNIGSLASLRHLCQSWDGRECLDTRP
jgi:hypothetical protein